MPSISIRSYCATLKYVSGLRSTAAYEIRGRAAKTYKLGIIQRWRIDNKLPLIVIGQHVTTAAAAAAN